MKAAPLFLLAIASVFFLNCQPKSEATSVALQEHPSTRIYYQLKEYRFDSLTQQKRTDTFLKDVYLPAVKRFGLNSIGVFKSRITEIDSLFSTYILLPFDRLEDVVALDDYLLKDSLYVKLGSSFMQNTHEAPPYDRISATLLRSFQLFSKTVPTPVEGPRSERVYELRSYGSPTEDYYWRKVDMFNGGGEMKIFDRLNFNPVFYGEVVAGDKMPNLMYMTTFPNMKVRDSLWQQFVDSPEWNGMKDLPKYLDTVSHFDVMLLYPTEYSDY
jgi:NIPSNAP